MDAWNAGTPPDQRHKSVSRHIFLGRRNVEGAGRLSCQPGVTCVSHFSAKRPVVLVVEDDFLIRMNAAQMIEAAGFHVVEAANSDEAIAVLEARLDITVVFTDIQMPGSMDGLKLAAAVRGRWPPIKIIATSGLVGVRKKDLPNGGRFLPKPYSPAQVIDALRELTGGG
jgi:CheY-like chemotaxis protein